MPPQYQQTVRNSMFAAHIALGRILLDLRRDLASIVGDDGPFAGAFSDASPVQNTSVWIERAGLVTAAPSPLSHR